MLNSKHLLIGILVTVFFKTYGQTKMDSPETDNSTVVQTSMTDTANFAIIDFDKSMYWLFDSSYKSSTLTKENELEIEKIFNESIADFNSNLSDINRKYFAIDPEHQKYYRQYWCVVNKNGEKEVYVNCFCKTFNQDWKQSLLQIEDGGNCFFHFKVNLATGKYYDFFVNR